MKKGGAVHPLSVDTGIGESVDEQIEKVTEEEEGDFQASLVIGALLIIPIIIVVAITVFLRLRKRGGCLSTAQSNHWVYYVCVCVWY